MTPPSSDALIEERAVAAPKGRLAGKTVVVTGAAGNLGTEICRTVVREGAFLVMTGRTRERVEGARDRLVAETRTPADRVVTAILDGGDPSSVRTALAEVKSIYGRIDVLINNAGSAGPKRPLDDVPLTQEEMEAIGETESVADAMRNLLGVTWNLARIAAPIMPVGGSMVNISTIFSHTRYFGRSAYVMPKAALNALSRRLARELGPRGIRVNTVFPGPIESERIRTVFAAMDAVQGNTEGQTADYFMGRMALKRIIDGKPKARSLPTPRDIAGACLFLASDESAALSGVEIDVTHGMDVRKESRSTFVERPSMRKLDGMGLRIFIAAGEAWEDALATAKMQLDYGAKVLLGLARQADVAQVEARTRAQGIGDALTVARFNRGEPETMEAVLDGYSATHGPLTGAVVFPVKGSGHYSGQLSEADDATVNEFLAVEMVGAVALARTLNRYWSRREDLLQSPCAVFMSNPSDGSGDTFNEVLAAGVTQLLQIWRDESRVAANAGRVERPVWANQIIRYTNAEEESGWFAAGHATRLVFNEQRIAEIDLRLPADIAVETGARRAMVGAAENITGLHLGKVALITGGSAGIGGQIARLLALAGAKVMMVARREAELDAARERIVGELQDVGFSGVERRVRTLANVDVSDFAALRRAVDATLEAFGRIDYLINNAGVAGAEEMVVDMDPDAWRHTLNANLVSNYVLMREVVPRMKAQGSGYVLNVSSYFGGEKFLAVAYPNRADYAVSKAGQRAMVESFSSALGPEVQFNAIAPGPVAGDRLAGTDGRPGLFVRRARLILQNKRLNAVYAAVIAAVRGGAEVDVVLSRLSRNITGALSHDALAPRELRELALQCARQGDGVCTWDRFVLTPELAARLLERLKHGGHLLEAPRWQTRGETENEGGGWLAIAPPDDVPFLPQEVIGEEADKVGQGVLSQLHLGRMPTEAEVAQATVFFLADRAVSGETFMPSGGLRVERSTTEREMFGSPKPERLAAMRGRTVWIVGGEHLSDYVVATVRHLVADLGVAHVVLLVRTERGGTAVAKAIGDLGGEAVHVVTTGAAIEATMDDVLARYGRPTTVVSMPNEALPDHLLEPEGGLSAEDFGRLVEENLTQHFRVARKASLYDGCQLVLVSPDVPQGTKGHAFALANFLKTTLHAFTATLAVENERLVHDVPTNQINLTRRVRSEEPRDEAEQQEELRRFVRAVMLVGAPLPDAQDSRYRARIYRGTSMTV
ncbi:SDR family NAD(P)-dependent oxidoreductase [Acuticoccus sp.]|uniref:SDR family NAD(P)-dependent oxidoreductase n=1 Tax=Acuticoccus sp. TaxID=1904378 RepID=UPI003B52B1C6